MITPPFELQLPLDEQAAGSLARRRIEHLGLLGEVEPAAIVELARAFPSLHAIYAAPDEELARVVGPVAAARIRWFLDAPLDTRLAREPDVAAPVVLRSAA